MCFHSNRTCIFYKYEWFHTDIIDFLENIGNIRLNNLLRVMSKQIIKSQGNKLRLLPFLIPALLNRSLVLCYHLSEPGGVTLQLLGKIGLKHLG